MPRHKPSPYAICRLSIAFVWFYHGLVPKLLGPDADELLMNMALGLGEAEATRLSLIAGTAEIALAACVLMFWQQRWPLIVTAVAMPTLLLFVVWFAPSLLTGAFNPVTTNVSVLALSLVGLALHTGRSEVSGLGKRSSA